MEETKTVLSKELERQAMMEGLREGLFGFVTNTVLTFVGLYAFAICAYAIYLKALLFFG